MSNNIYSISEHLKQVSVTPESLSLIEDGADIWDMFGKKNSHLLRAKLFKLFADKKVPGDSILMIFFFFAVIKNKTRVLNSFDELPDTMKANSSTIKAKEFIQDSLVQYTTQETAKKFAVVHLPTTSPGLDIMLTALICQETEIEAKIYSKQTFAQLNLNDELQAINKTQQTMFWNNTVKSSKNEARKNKGVTEDLKFHEDYYNTSAADKYLLVDLNLKEVNPSAPEVGYTKADILAWYKTLIKDKETVIKKNNKKAAASSPS
jgi:hypothetical protein